MKKIRVLLADDHTLVRAGIRALLEQLNNIEIVGEAGDGLQALELIKQHQPDIVLLDLTMPKLSGLNVLQEAATESDSIRFIVLTMHDNEEYVIRALRSGASGFIPKSAASTELEAAINTVVKGDYYVSPKISQQAILKYAKGQVVSGPATPLTPRQAEILTMIAQGRSTKQIATDLNITVKTVESHRAQLMERLNIHDVAGLVRYAIRTGLIPVDDQL